MQYVHRPGDPWSDVLRAARGTTLRLRLEPAGGYRWTAVTSSDTTLAEITETAVDVSGAATATVSFHSSGAVTLSATTSYVPDPHGPPTRIWRLTLTIEP